MPRKADKKSESKRRQSPKPTSAGKPSSSRATKSKTQQSQSRKAVASEKPTGGARGVVKRVVSTVVGALTRRKTKTAAAEKTAGSGTARKTQAAARPVRVAKRQADIPMDEIAAAYTPTQTSLKAPFRASGAPRQRDQEYANGASDARWNDEDRLTNKSGDPRIGTHGRTYEPGEKRATKRADQDE